LSIGTCPDGDQIGPSQQDRQSVHEITVDRDLGGHLDRVSAFQCAQRLSVDVLPQKPFESECGLFIANAPLAMDELRPNVGRHLDPHLLQGLPPRSDVRAPRNGLIEVEHQRPYRVSCFHAMTLAHALPFTKDQADYFARLFFPKMPDAGLLPRHSQWYPEFMSRPTLPPNELRTFCFRLAESGETDDKMAAAALGLTPQTFRFQKKRAMAEGYLRYALNPGRCGVTALLNWSRRRTDRRYAKDLLKRLKGQSAQARTLKEVLVISPDTAGTAEGHRAIRRDFCRH
jgi:hypothetical protein